MGVGWKDNTNLYQDHRAMHVETGEGGKGLKRFYYPFKPTSSQPPTFSYMFYNSLSSVELTKKLHGRNCQPLDQDRESVDRHSSSPPIYHPNTHQTANVKSFS